MNTVLFRSWLIDNGVSKKVAGDTVSRLKKINLALINSTYASSIDDQYALDQCQGIIKLLKLSSTESNEIKSNLQGLPFNKVYISTYKLALVRYVKFKNEVQNG